MAWAKRLEVRPPTVLLTDEEHDLVSRLGRWVEDFARVARSPSSIAGSDINEAIAHVHALQNMVLAQAAARAYPKRYRLLGRPLGP